MDAGEDADEVSLECVDGTFRDVAAMDIGGTSWYVASQMSVTCRRYSLLALLSMTWWSTTWPRVLGRVMMRV